MKTVHPILVDYSVNISEFKQDPMLAISVSGGLPVAIINKNEPVFYCIPAEYFEMLVDKLDDLELAQLVKKRKEAAEIDISIDDL